MRIHQRVTASAVLAASALLGIASPASAWRFTHPSERAAITRVVVPYVRAHSTPNLPFVVGSIKVSTVDPRWALAPVNSPVAGRVHVLVWYRAGRWWPRDIGGAAFGCSEAPARAIRDLQGGFCTPTP